MATIKFGDVGLNGTSHIVVLLSSFAVLYLVYSIALRLYDVYFGPLSNIPGPKLWAFSRDPRLLAMVSGDEGVTYKRLHEKYGPVFRSGPKELSFAGGASAWKDVYGFRKNGALQKDRQFYGLPLNRVASAITADNVTHSRQRKVLSHSFSDKGLKEQEPLLKKWSDLMRTKMAEQADGTTKLDMVKFYNCTTFDIMADLTFSESLNMLRDSEYSPWVKGIFAGIKRATLFRGLRAHDAVTKYVIENILFKSKAVQKKRWEHWNYSKERVDRRLQREPEHPDLWSIILAKKEEDGGLSVEELHSNAGLFMIAGTETTATALSGTTYHLLQNPSTMQKLQDEIRSGFTDFNDVTFENLARLKYLHAVLQEGLRMYPPVPVSLPRVTPPEGATIDGTFVPGGISVGVSHLATYHSSTHFKNPLEFHPERWLGDPEYADDHLDALEPFSVGPRNCLGKNLAWHEMRILLVNVVLHFDLELCAEAERWSDQKIYALWEKRPLMCTLRLAKR